MRNLSPRQLAFVIAITGAFMVLLSMVLVYYFKFQPAWLVWVLVSSGAFIILFHMVKFFLLRLIVERINPIYKSIQNINIAQKDLLRTSEKKDIFRVVENDVIKWAQKRSSEIAELKKMEQYRKEFMGNVMHELKTPIFNI